MESSLALSPAQRIIAFELIDVYRVHDEKLVRDLRGRFLIKEKALREEVKKQTLLSVLEESESSAKLRTLTQFGETNTACETDEGADEREFWVPKSALQTLH